jgi:D-alanine-D-alanine ligase
MKDGKIMKVAVLYGEVHPDAGEDEKDVLVEVEFISKILRESGYETEVLPLSLDMKRTINKLEEIKPSFVFNLVETVEGRGNLIYLSPALLNHLNIPHTGSKLDAIYLTSNKVITKKILKSSGINTPFWFEIKDFLKDNISFEGPCIIKSIWEHASIGLDEYSVIFSREKLEEEINNRLDRGEKDFFIESYIDGREFNISLLAGKDGPELLPHGEIKFVDYENKIKVVGYRAKWDASSFEYHHTNRSFDFSEEDRHLLEKLSEISIKCWNLFNLSGYARVDFRVDNDGNPWVLEVNINPCVSPDAGFMAAANRAGLSFKEVVKRIIEEVKSEE